MDPILDSTTANSLLTQVTGFISDNIAGLLVVLGGAVGISVAFGVLRFAIAKLSGAWKR